MTSSPADRLHAVFWIAALAVLLVAFHALAGILTPFLLAGILAYIANPAADRLTGLGLPRAAAVLLVLGVLALIVGLLAFLIFPLFFAELETIAARAPQAIERINQDFLPWLEHRFGLHLQLDPAALKTFAAGNLGLVQNILERLYSSAQLGGSLLLSLLVNLLLVPVVMFYLLLDWHRLLGRLTQLVPLPWQARLTALANDIDAVLTQYLRGQLLVMLLLAVYYSGALWLASIPSALSIGLVSGLLIFIPYLGFASGFGLALLVAALQFAGWPPVLAVLLIYGLGQLLESFLLTPYLVGERIGLHPLAVIFALLAFGQLFGFFGVLLALPAAAVLAVGLRELRRAYLASRFYLGRQ
ncbi:MAG: AI-2E family transporter [Betaproteobacteria bacterium HGW-Betaproteobacteria-11]|nr:MAG: AI-2E family transporter [Betaproteobacteria bacterium HGW-Betaproteobacteria-11]